MYENDLKMRAAMYGVLFEAFADQNQWEEGLRAMDDAVRDMPRTSHRLYVNIEFSIPILQLND